MVRNNYDGVREATSSDVEACAGVHVRSWQHAYRGLLPDEYLDNLTAADRVGAWEQWLAEPKVRGCVLVVEVDGAIAGFGSFVAHDELGPDWALLPTLYLEPAVIGRGHGRALMHAGLDRLRAFGYADVELWTHPDNARARAFYEAGGWVGDGTTRTEVVWGVELAVVRYTRSLREGGRPPSTGGAPR